MDGDDDQRRVQHHRSAARASRRSSSSPPTSRPTRRRSAPSSKPTSSSCGPGSLLTSVLPNLLVDGIRQALAISQATKIYVCNVATQHGETDDFSVSDHFETLVQHVGPGLFDYVLANDNVAGPAAGRLALAARHRRYATRRWRPRHHRRRHLREEPLPPRLQQARGRDHAHLQRTAASSKPPEELAAARAAR